MTFRVRRHARFSGSFAGMVRVLIRVLALLVFLPVFVIVAYTGYDTARQYGPVLQTGLFGFVAVLGLLANVSFNFGRTLDGDLANAMNRRARLLFLAMLYMLGAAAMSLLLFGLDGSIAWFVVLERSILKLLIGGMAVTATLIAYFQVSALSHCILNVDRDGYRPEQSVSALEAGWTRIALWMRLRAG